MNVEHTSIVWATVPQTGGTYRFYQLLRKAVEPLGWTVWGVSVGCETTNWDDSLADDHCVKVGKPTDSFAEAVKAFIEWVSENNISIVMPVGSSIMSSAMPHMPADIKFLMQGNSITRHTYATTLVHRDRVSHYIGISQRHYDDLTKRYKVPAEKITLIPHALDFSNSENALYRKNHIEGTPMKIAYLGRLIDIDKGIFLIPKILDKLQKNKIPFYMEIAGDGPDKEKFEHKLENLIKNGTVIMRGNIHHDDVPSFLASSDVFLMPSNFEGFGFTLIEAMAAGCVPVVSRISGVTDWIVTQEKTGLLCPIGDADAFFKAIAKLYSNCELRTNLSSSARQEVIERFEIDKFSTSYDITFNKVLSDKTNYTPLNLGKLALARPYNKSWHQLVPSKLKLMIRKIQERLRVKAHIMKRIN